MTGPLAIFDSSPQPRRAGFVGRLLGVALIGLVACGGQAGVGSDAWGGEVEEEGYRPEVPDDPPDLSTAIVNGTSAAATVTYGRFTSVQVNVSAAGANITRDAANEPSIAVDPNDASRIAIGWRQFDSINSNFRQAGFGWSTNGGLSWATGKIDPGIFRSDPVLDSDALGKFFFNSLAQNFACTVFPSTNGGATWGAGVAAYGGDKQWMTIDRTGGLGHDNIYEAWSLSANPTPPYTFSRSTDAGQSYQFPIAVPNSPNWGTLDVAPDGTLYLVGTAGSGGPIYVARSANAKDPGVTPTFTAVQVNLGGTMADGGPNPVGLLGQLWIAVDKSGGPRQGWVYVLASVRTPTDPLDVSFIRSTDGGQTWSAPRRINDDPIGNRAFQWFGTMSVAPNGRIDAVWNDSRGSTDSTQSALFYSSSMDGGVTWSTNEQASPVWDCTIGWPHQNKIGDYYDMVSRDAGADLAWSATFNGEQDVYFMRITPGPVAVADEPPGRARLLGAWPNPFTSSTTIRFEVPAGGANVRLEVLDVAGRRAATLLDGFTMAGAQTISWRGVDDHGRPMRAGIYLCRLATSGTTQTAKLMLLE